jgi:hypothetical protein
MKKKTIFIFLPIVIFVIVCVIIVSNYKTIRYLIPNSIKENLPTSILLFHEDIMVPLQTRINSFKNHNYFYNVVLLPETHFTSLNIKRYSLQNSKNFEDRIFSDEKTQYFLDLYDDNVFVISAEANLFFFKQDDINSQNYELNLTKVDTNLSDLKSELTVLDSYINDGYIFVSGYQYSLDEEKNCKKFRLYRATLNYKRINFEEIYNNDQCAFAKFMQAGRIQKYNLDGRNGILFSMGENEIDKPNEFPQDDLSDYGKFIFLDLDNLETQVFSKGHRNPQGLLVDGNDILSTEHGPYGGDEINKIKRGKNYGWPLASYGTYYNTDKKKYLKSHKKYGFEEPIFTFIKAIGISEIIKIPNIFIGENDLDNLYFISSLNGRSLFLIKLENNKEKVSFIEKIFINQRIRDLKYIEKYNSVILALEHPSQIAILKN